MANHRNRSDRVLVRQISADAAYDSNLQGKILFLALMFLVLVFYVLTLCNQVSGGDSGELIGVINELGVAHPPGYPLYTLLGKVFTLIPVGTVAWKVSLFSAVAGCVAAAFVFKTVLIWGGYSWAAFLAAGLFSFSPLVWTYSVSQEVFALNNLFIAGLLYFGTRLYQRYSEPLALLFALWVGLGFSHHHSFGLFAIPIVVGLFIFHRRELLKGSVPLKILVCFTLGLLPYLYLPLASSYIPFANWGDQTTLSGLLQHVLRQEYGTFQLSNERTGNEGEVFRRLWIYLKTIPAQSAYAGLLLLLIGLLSSFYLHGKKAWAWFVCLSYGLYLLVFCILSNLELNVPLSLEVQSRFWQQPNLIVCIWIGLGLSFLAKKWNSKQVHWLLAATSVLLIVAQICLNYTPVKQNKNDVLENYARLILDMLPQDALLLYRGDHTTGTLNYIQKIDKYRQDVLTLNTSYLTKDWSPRWIKKYFSEINVPAGLYLRTGYHFKQLLDQNRSKFRIFSIFGAQVWDKSALSDYQAWNCGIAEELLLKGQEPDFDTWVDVNNNIFARFDSIFKTPFKQGSWEANILSEYLQARHNFAVQLLNYAVAHNAMEKALRLALANFEAIEPQFATQDPVIYKNMGAVYHQLVRYDKKTAVEGLKKSWRIYLATKSSATDPQRPAVAELLRQFENFHQ